MADEKDKPGEPPAPARMIQGGVDFLGLASLLEVAGWVLHDASIRNRTTRTITTIPYELLRNLEALASRLENYRRIVTDGRKSEARPRDDQAGRPIAIEQLLQGMKIGGWEFHLAAVRHKETGLVAELTRDVLRDPKALEDILVKVLPDTLRRMVQAAHRRDN